MENLYVKRVKILEEALAEKEFLGCGGEGSCFKINSKIVLKYYNDQFQEYFNSLSQGREFLLRFKDLDLPSFCFVKALVLEGDYTDAWIIGVLMDYVAGKNLNEANLYLCDINKLIQAIEVLKQDIWKLSELGITINDVFDGNIMYARGKFTLIDTVCYEQEPLPFRVLYEDNLVKVMREIVHSLIKNTQLLKILRYKNSVLENCLCEAEMLLEPEELICGLKREAEDYYERKLTSFRRTVNM